MVAIAVILILAYVTAIFLRKRNVSRLTALEERKEELYNLPVNDEVEAVKNMHLIGQSQVTFREWNQKWVDLSLNSFADIENHLFEAESYNNSFRFFKAAHKIDQIESQIGLIEEDIAAIRNALSELEKQESKNSGRVLHALDLFESLQHTVAEDSEKYGKALPEIEKQLENIQSEFSQFVTLNSSGDPVEAAAILDSTENHILALTHIVERIPALVETLTKELPEQLADLEEGYRKLLDANYHFTETDIESRFQLLHESLKNNQENIRQLELDNAEYENNRIQEEINALYDIFTREIAAQKGLILVDTKYEFGKRDGKCYLIDEIHTPDSRRYFYADGYEEKLAKGEPQKQLSKEFVRQWLIEHNFMNEPGQSMPEITDEYAASVGDRYIELYEHITGETFVKVDNEIDLAGRIEKNVSQYLASRK